MTTLIAARLLGWDDDAEPVGAGRAPMPVGGVHSALPMVAGIGRNAPLTEVVTRRPALAPHDNSRAAFEFWLADADKTRSYSQAEIDEWHVEMCAAMGWPLPKPLPLTTVTPRISVPVIETHTDDAPEIETPTPEPTPEEDADGPAYRRVKLDEAAAAERFIEWLRIHHPGQHTAAHIDSLYIQHCDAEDLEEIGSKAIKTAMIASGVQRDNTKEVWSGGRYGHGKRHRPTLWIIEPISIAADIPWDDLASERAA